MNLYNDIGRGPPENHVLGRFATTYATSYRSYDESRPSIPVRCVPNRPLTTDSQFSPDKSHVSTHQSVHSPNSKFAPLDTTPSNQHRPFFPRFVTPANTAQDTSSADGDQNTHYHVYLPLSSSASLNSGHLPLNNCPGNHRGFNEQNSLQLANTTSQPSASEYSAAGNGTTSKAISGNHSLPCSSSIVVYQGCPKESTETAIAGEYRAGSSTNSRDRSTDCQQFKTVLVTSAPAPSSERTRLTITSPSPRNQPVDIEQMYSQIARINNHLYLCSLSAITPDRLRQYGITLLVSAMTDVPPQHIRSAVSSCMHINVEDIESACLRVHFDRVADRIAAEHRRGGRALVHCIAGVSRSSSLILAYLMRHMQMSLADAYKLVRSIRPCIQPNPGFWRQLLEYEERIRGSRSVRVVPPISYPSSSYSAVIEGNRSFPITRRITTDALSKPRRDLSYRSHIQPYLYN